MLQVDAKPYVILGTDVNVTKANVSLAEQLAAVVTPTRSSFLLNAGPIVVNMTFLSSVEVRMLESL